MTKKELVDALRDVGDDVPVMLAWGGGVRAEAQVVAKGSSVWCDRLRKSGEAVVLSEDPIGVSEEPSLRLLFLQS